MELEDTMIQDYIRLAYQARQTLDELTRITPYIRKRARQTNDKEIVRTALANGRAIRGAYASFLKELTAFDESACLVLLEYDKSLWMPQPQDAGADSATTATQDKRGTPKYRRLAAMAGWPYLIDKEAAAQSFGLANEEYFLDQPSWPAGGSFDSRAFILRGKFEKWAAKTASALHHLCAILTLFQRPGDKSNGGRAGKLALAKLIQDYLDEWQGLERQVIDAIQEAAEQR